MSELEALPLETPGRGLGIIDVVRNRYLLRLVTRKEVQVRYRGSWLGILWSYIKPLTQFLVFYIALGVFLGMNKGIQNYAVYLFSGIVVMNYFTEAFGNAARSIVGNGGLIKKIYLPRMLFPVSSLWVAVVHFVPQLVVLLLACLIFGWVPTPIGLLGAVAAFVIVSLLALGMGLLFATADVFFRDAENFVDLIIMVITWASPVLYMWTMVDNEVPWLTPWYMVNPLTVAVELFHVAFWRPTAPDVASWHVPPHLYSQWTPVALVISAVLLALGQAVFRRFEGQFAQEL